MANAARDLEVLLCEYSLSDLLDAFHTALVNRARYNRVYFPDEASELEHAAKVISEICLDTQA